MVGKIGVEKEVGTVSRMVSKSVGRTYWKITCCKNRTRCGIITH